MVQLVSRHPNLLNISPSLLTASLFIRSYNLRLCRKRTKVGVALTPNELVIVPLLMTPIPTILEIRPLQACIIGLSYLQRGD